MPYLIDTPILIWYNKGDRRLSSRIVNLIENPDELIYVSKVSLWEITIKSALGKLDIGIPFLELEPFLQNKGFTIIDFEFAALNILHTLPFHHGDPFDRLIIAQAIANHLPLISDDGKFSRYPVDLVLA